jgi:hypothetical protein
VALRDANASAPKVAALPDKQGGQAAPSPEATVAPTTSASASPVPAAGARSLQAGQGAGVANGGTGSGAGAGNGTGGEGGTGSGDGGDGTGTGSLPCGAVFFAGKTAVGADGTNFVFVRLVLHLRDGTTEEDELHWQFIYPNAQANPFVNSRASETTLQMPPPGYALEEKQKPATVYVVHHTKSGGTTDLPPCPK